MFAHAHRQFADDFIVLPRGQYSIAWFSIAALLGIVVLVNVGGWYRKNRSIKGKSAAKKAEYHPDLSSKKVAVSITILMALIFSKYFYLASLTSYYTFYLINKFHLPVRSAQIHLFMFLGAVALFCPLAAWRNSSGIEPVPWPKTGAVATNDSDFLKNSRCRPVEFGASPCW